MASHYWIKLYHEILDDPKMGRLRDSLWRRVIECFLMAGEMQADGYLPALEDMAWRLHTNAEMLEAELSELARIGILDQRDGGWFVVNFEERQSAMSAAERAKRWRERQRKQDYYGEQTPGERKPNDSFAEEEKEKEVDTEEIARVTPSVESFCNHCGTPPPDLEKAPRTSWVDPGLKIIGTAGGDPAEAAKLVQATLQYMDRKELSYSNLGSLVNVARTVWNGRSLNGSGEEAFEMLSGAIQDNAYQDLPDPIKDTLRSMGTGTSDLNSMTPKDLDFFKPQFIKAYHGQ